MGTGCTSSWQSIGRRNVPSYGNLTKDLSWNKDSPLSHSHVLKFVAIGQLVGRLAIHTFNWVAFTSWTFPARQRKLRC